MIREQALIYKTIELDKGATISTCLGNIAVPAARVVGLHGPEVNLLAGGIPKGVRPYEFSYGATLEFIRRLRNYYEKYAVSYASKPPQPSSLEFALYVGGFEPPVEKGLLRDEEHFTNAYNFPKADAQPYIMPEQVCSIVHGQNTLVSMVSCGGGSSDMGNCLTVAGDDLVFVSPEDMFEAAAKVAPIDSLYFSLPVIAPRPVPELTAAPVTR